MTQSSTRRRRDWLLRPSVARIDNFFLSGSDHYPPDRHLAGLLYEEAPWLPDMVLINQQHRPKAVTALARDLGIRRFVDLGCGLPSAWNRRLQQAGSTYDAASAVHPDAHVVYVDNDPMVGGHARMTLCESVPGTASVEADIRQIHALLQHPRIEGLRTEPVAVPLHDLLPWMSDESAWTVMTALHVWLPAGSAISVTHTSSDMAPEAMKTLTNHYANAGITYRPRTLDEIKTLLDPWTPLPPGITPTSQWPTPSRKSTALSLRTPHPGHSFAYAALAVPGTPSDPASPTAARTPKAAS
ncbi:SAM-dependent methyltransferase [Streptomyces sp. NBC_01471]|uniref:SAM-dependent methyltransferase n=1 Tax=Streptomyces sp. NBC_01471 TaxID=2903879 RepID=UPI00325280CA